jgi:DNA processing protein
MAYPLPVYLNMELPFPADHGAQEILRKPISPMKELVAYEALWRDKKMSFKYLAQLFARQPGKLPSDLVPPEFIDQLYAEVKAVAMNPSMAYRINLLIHGSFDYPSRLREAEEPVEILYYAGQLDYLSTRSLAVVGTRKPTDEGLRQTQELARFMVSQDFTIVSGLAAGIDTAAHTAAIEAGGRTIAVIGTPMDQTYPAANTELQKKIAREHLLISQVPFIRYREQSINGNRLFFPERNKTMSALTEATIIVEAGQTSGTLIQARAALYQGRKLFILDRCFQNKSITWPTHYEQQGAVRIKHFEEILKHLPAPRLHE